MTMKRVVLTLVLIVSSSLAACRPPAADATQDEGAVRQVFDTYIKSVNTADAALASNVWLQSPDLVVVTPFGRFQGWDQVREEVYVKFLKETFSERDLRPSNVSLHVMGDSAWLAFDWAFTAKLANGPAIASKGWESHVYRKTDQGWRIVHLHYSVPPPLPPSPPANP
jgi:ketosteroid isomerase-like protein